MEKAKVIAGLLRIPIEDIDMKVLERAVKAVESKNDLCFDAHANIGQMVGNTSTAHSIAIVYSFLMED